MPNVTIYSSDYITVEYWPDHNSIYHVVHQPISGQLPIFKEALNAGTEALQKYNVHKWLSDDRKNDALTPEGNAWSFSDWQPRTMKAGWKYWALVVPNAAAAAGTLAPVIEQLFELGLRMMVFANVEEAVAWLDSFEN
jgi:hypothetical protein